MIIVGVVSSAAAEHQRAVDPPVARGQLDDRALRASSARHLGVGVKILPWLLQKDLPALVEQRRTAKQGRMRNDLGGYCRAPDGELDGNGPLIDLGPERDATIGEQRPDAILADPGGECSEGRVDQFRRSLLVFHRVNGLTDTVQTKKAGRKL